MHWSSGSSASRESTRTTATRSSRRFRSPRYARGCEAQRNERGAIRDSRDPRSHAHCLRQPNPGARLHDPIHDPGIHVPLPDIGVSGLRDAAHPLRAGSTMRGVEIVEAVHQRVPRSERLPRRRRQRRPRRPARTPRAPLLRSGRRLQRARQHQDRRPGPPSPGGLARSSRPLVASARTDTTGPLAAAAPPETQLQPSRHRLAPYVACSTPFPPDPGHTARQVTAPRRFKHPFFSTSQHLISMATHTLPDGWSLLAARPREELHQALLTSACARTFEDIPIDWWDEDADVWRPTSIVRLMGGVWDVGRDVEVLVPDGGAISLAHVSIARVRLSKLLTAGVSRYWVARYQKLLVLRLIEQAAVLGCEPDPLRRLAGRIRQEGALEEAGATADERAAHPLLVAITSLLLRSPATPMISPAGSDSRLA